MGDTNGSMRRVEIDVTNDQAFKTGVVQTLQLIADQTACIPELKKKVDKHEQAYQVGKYASIPVVALIHAGTKALLAKLGW